MTLRAKLITRLAGFVLAAIVGVSQSADAAPRRIVSVGGAVTEILVDLGLQADLVAVDTTSTFPEAAVATLPRVGYMRQLSAEGVIALRPSDVLVIEGSGPADALALIRETGVPVTLVPEQFSPDGVALKIRAIGSHLDRGAAAEALASRTLQQFETVKAGNALIRKPVRVLFALSTQGGRLMASGRGTAADQMITLAGAANAVDGFNGYKPLTDEAIVAAAPDAVLVMDHAGQAASEILAFPALAQTPAARSGRLITMDGMYLLGFGPRTPAAAADLRARLYPDIHFPETGAGR